MSVQYSDTAVLSALGERASKSAGSGVDFVVTERRGRGGFHVIQVDLAALKSKGNRLGPIRKGELLCEARDSLVAAGYEVEDLDGYNGRDGFVAWPHLRIIEPGTGFGAQSQANTQAMTQLAAAVASLAQLVTKGSPELAEQAQAITASALTTAGTMTTEDTANDTEDGVEEADETFGGASA